MAVESLDQGRHVCPPEIIILELLYAGRTSSRLFVLVALPPAYPGTVGSSGRVHSTLSRAFLNASTVMFCRFLIDCGSTLYSFGPLIAKLPSRSVAVLEERAFLSVGTLQYSPRRSLKCVVIGFVFRFGARLFIIFHV